MPILSDPRFKEQDLQNEWDSMTPKEIQEVERDKLGTNQPVVETPEMLHDALTQLDEEIQNIQEKEAYELATVMCPEYVRSVQFRSMFLRATCFDATQAAEKIVKYWCRKVALFGPDRSFHKLSIHDMDEEDQLALNQGGIRSLPERDEAGRGVVLSCRNLWDNRGSHRNSMLRLLWFVMHDLVEDDVDMQKNGIVSVSTNTLADHQITSFDQKSLRMCWKDANEVLPIRVHYNHIFGNTTFLATLFREMVLFAAGNKKNRARCRFHPNNSLEDFIHGVEDYGISPTNLPKFMGGSSEFVYDAWLEELRNEEN